VKVANNDTEQACVIAYTRIICNDTMHRQKKHGVACGKLTVRTRIIAAGNKKISIELKSRGSWGSEQNRSLLYDEALSPPGRPHRAGDRWLQATKKQMPAAHKPSAWV
jgi:hypothetical protein